MKQRKLFLVVLFTLALLCTLAAADVKVKVGGKSLVLPQPNSSTPSTNKNSELMQYFESEEMRALAFFMDTADQERIDNGMIPREPFYFVLSYIPLEKLNFEADEFTELLDTMGNEVESAFSTGFNSSVGEGVDETEADMFMLGRSYDCDDYVVYSLLMKFTMDEVSANYVGNMVMANVGGKLVYCFGMQKYSDYRTIGDLEESTKQWMNTVVKANQASR